MSGAYAGTDSLAPKKVTSLAGASVTTAAYAQLTTAAANTKGTAALYVHNTTGALVKLALGEAGVEVDIPFYIPSGLGAYIYQSVKAGVRISCRAVDTNGTTGNLVVNQLG